VTLAVISEENGVVYEEMGSFGLAILKYPDKGWRRRYYG